MTGEAHHPTLKYWSDYPSSSALLDALTDAAKRGRPWGDVKAELHVADRYRIWDYLWAAVLTSTHLDETTNTQAAPTTAAPLPSDQH